MKQMIERFSGTEGRRNLLDSISEQAIVGGNVHLAAFLADAAELIPVETSDAIIIQDAEDDDLYLIIAGSFSVIVNGQRVATRGKGDHVGEMSLIEPSQRRSASVVADEPSVVAKLTADVVREVASQFPEIYRQIAKTLSRRLRERNKLVGQFREKIKLFIISSVEALPVARIIQNSFEHDDFVTILWTDGVFRATNYFLKSLEDVVLDSDFAVAVAHGDDVTTFRGQDWPAPRDNVIFELGLFMGKLGRERAILMEPREDKIKLPSDLSGVTTIPYKYEGGKHAAALMAPACNRLRDHILEFGPYNG